MDDLTKDRFDALLVPAPGPWVSIYLPLHVDAAEEDELRLRDLAHEAEVELRRRGFDRGQIEAVLSPIERIWSEGGMPRGVAGVATFLRPGSVTTYGLPVEPAALASVGDRPVVKPLLPVITATQRFLVLALSQNAVRLLECGRFDERERALPGVPRSLAESLRFEDANVERYAHASVRSGGLVEIGHGHGIGGEVDKGRIERYLLDVAHGLKPILRDDEGPLVLAAVDYEAAIFRSVNPYPHLLEAWLPGNPDHTPAAELRRRAWALVEHVFEEARAGDVRRFERLQGTGLCGTDAAEVVRAAADGRVATLFVALDRERWGVVGPDGIPEPHEVREPGDEDLVDLAIALALEHRAQVHVVAPGGMPGGGELAAIYRY